MDEIWKPIPDFEGYEVSDKGQVRSYYKRKENTFPPKWIISDKPQRILSPSTTNGYLGIGLRANGKAYFRKIHQLVLLAFIGPRPDGMETCHNNGIKNDNGLENLRYDTHQANIQDAVTHGVAGGAILTQVQIKEIRQDYRKNWTSQKELAERYGVSPSTISEALRGKSFAHVDIPVVSSFDKLNERAKQIRIIYRKGKKTMQQLANKYNMSESGISRIINGSRCPDAGGPIKSIDY